MKKLPIMRISNVSKIFDDKLVLRDLTFDIYENEILAILGRSGCGKSTLFKILTGIYEPNTGEISYHGNKIYDKKIKTTLRKIIGFVSQENSFYESLTVYENLYFFGKVYGLKKKEINSRIEELLLLINLYEQKNVISNKLSGGMKRRLEFAISLIHDPEILILDEPFTGLDMFLVKEIWNLIIRIRDSGVTIVLSTHNLKNLDELVEKWIIIEKGKLKYNSSYDGYFHEKNIENIFIGAFEK